MTKESIFIMCILIYVATKYLFTLLSVAFPFLACMIKSNMTPSRFAYRYITRILN